MRGISEHDYEIDSVYVIGVPHQPRLDERLGWRLVLALTAIGLPVGMAIGHFLIFR